MSDLQIARERLQKGDCTCVLCKGGDILTSSQRGVKPLLDWIDSGKDFSGFCAADKVVGNGAAYLYAILRPKSLYAPLMSKAACLTLERFGIDFIAGTTVDGIRNRAGTGPCPMEAAVAGVSTPQAALKAIRQTLASLQS